MAHRFCVHGFDVFRCKHETCPNCDKRPLWEQLFGHSPNSALAAELFRTNRAAYDAAKLEAIKNNVLPTAKLPACLE
jgi:hypothetical protein